MNEHLLRLQQRVDSNLCSLLEALPVPAPSIFEAMRYVVLGGGKRLRPLLVYLCGEALSVPIACLDVLANSVEILHCYSLVHDDLPAMDNDDFRRGKPSCHKAFDEATAILVGDALQALSVEHLLQKLPAFVGPEVVINVGLELVTAAGASGMVSGQGLDLTRLACPGLAEAELRSIHALKTGRLILACINMVLAVRPLKHNLAEMGLIDQALQSYAKHLGLVFQMQDDYLDAYAPQKALGKNRASDLANQKTTFASYYQQQDLQALIDHQYSVAKAALAPLDQAATGLLVLTDYLQKRS